MSSLSSRAITDNACVSGENAKVAQLRKEITDLNNQAYKIYHDGKKDTPETKKKQDALAKPIYESIGKKNKAIDAINQGLSKKCTKIVSGEVKVVSGEVTVWKNDITNPLYLKLKTVNGGEYYIGEPLEIQWEGGTGDPESNGMLISIQEKNGLIGYQIVGNQRPI